jgi:dihydroorotase
MWNDVIELPGLIDLHVHLRQEGLLERVAPLTAAHCAAALVMPNLLPEPLQDGTDVAWYRSEVLGAFGVHACTPLMTIALTPQTTPATISSAVAAGAVAAKLYPAGATTNSQHGISVAALVQFHALEAVLETMATLGMVLCVHAEDPDAPVLSREVSFISVVHNIATRHPTLRIVVEHVSTRDMVDYINAAPPNVYATVTGHHLNFTLDDLLGGMLRPDFFCKPVVKTAADREKLRQLAISNRRCMAGSDSAPHEPPAKYGARGAAGFFCPPTLMVPLVAAAFESAGAVPQQLAEFLYNRGVQFHLLGEKHPLPPKPLRLVRDSWEVPAELGGVTLALAGENLPWRLERIY